MGTQKQERKMNETQSSDLSNSEVLGGIKMQNFDLDALD